MWILLCFCLLVSLVHSELVKLYGLDDAKGNPLSLSMYRSLVFQANDQKIQTINRQNRGYRMGHNSRFSYWSEREFRESYLTQLHRHDEVEIQYRQPVRYNNANRMKNDPFYEDYMKMVEIGKNIDYRKSGMVTPIETQGSCGACYSFSITGALESAYLLKNITVELSVQELIDCTDKYKIKGCSGGSFVNGYFYVLDKGLYSAADYPYTGKKGDCKEMNKTKFKISSAYLINNYPDDNVTYGGCVDVYKTLEKQPVVTGVMASTDWMFYASGIYDACQGYLQGNYNQNHAVVIVGYKPSDKKTQGYWLIRNSWGADWGEQGYMRLSTQKSITPCNICFYSAYAEL